MEKIRILHVVSAMNQGGIENAIMNFYRNIDREKVQFDFLMRSSEKGVFDDEIEALGGKIYRIQSTNPIKTILEADKFIKKNKKYYKAMHVHFLTWGSPMLVSAKIHGWKNRISHIHYAGGDLKGFSPIYILKRCLREVIKTFSTYYFACSNTAGKYYFGKRIIKKPEYRTINNAININKFNFDPTKREAVRKQLDISDSTIVLGHVSRLHPIKNPKFTIDVLNSLLKRGKDVKCIFVGDGEIRGEMEKHAKELGCLDRCLFTGAVYNPYDYMQAMDAFIFPSKVEGLGMVAIEAQTAGLKCFNSTGVPKECQLTDLTFFTPLEEGPDRWADLIEKELPYEREGQAENTKAKGYDIIPITKELEEFYLSLT